MTKFATENLILGIYGTVKFYDHMDMEKYMNFPLMVVMMAVFVLTFYPKNATIYESSKGEHHLALRLCLKRFAGKVWKRAGGSTVKASKWKNLDVKSVTAIMMKDLRKGKTASSSEHASSYALPGFGELKEIKCIARSCPTVGIPFGSL